MSRGTSYLAWSLLVAGMLVFGTSSGPPVELAMASPGPAAVQPPATESPDREAPDPGEPAGDQTQVNSVETVHERDPESLADLRELQKRVQDVTARLTPCTVGLQIGSAMGSGVIVSEDGLVLTAAHVTSEPGKSLQVILHDGRRVRGISLGMNHPLDAGLVRITAEGEKWPFAEMAPDHSLSVGEWCVALGHPGGYQGGRPPVVRLGRVVMARRGTVQTDCTLVGGDSGGPLFDLDGRVVGIHSRIGAADDWNFHVAISCYSENWDRMLASESWGMRPGQRRQPNRARLGVTGSDDPGGCRITNVLEESPAEKAGFQVGEVIRSVDGKPVRGIQGLIDVIGSFRPGDMVEVEVEREGVVSKRMVILGRMTR